MLSFYDDPDRMISVQPAPWPRRGESLGKTLYDDYIFRGFEQVANLSGKKSNNQLLSGSGHFDQNKSATIASS